MHLDGKLFRIGARPGGYIHGISYVLNGETRFGQLLGGGPTPRLRIMLTVQQLDDMLEANNKTPLHEAWRLSFSKHELILTVISASHYT